MFTYTEAGTYHGYRTIHGLAINLELITRFHLKNSRQLATIYRGRLFGVPMEITGLRKGDDVTWTITSGRTTWKFRFNLEDEASIVRQQKLMLECFGDTIDEWVSLERHNQFYEYLSISCAPIHVLDQRGYRKWFNKERVIAVNPFNANLRVEIIEEVGLFSDKAKRTWVRFTETELWGRDYTWKRLYRPTETE